MRCQCESSLCHHGDEPCTRTPQPEPVRVDYMGPSHLCETCAYYRYHYGGYAPSRSRPVDPERGRVVCEMSMPVYTVTTFDALNQEVWTSVTFTFPEAIDRMFGIAEDLGCRVDAVNWADDASDVQLICEFDEVYVDVQLQPVQPVQPV